MCFSSGGIIMGSKNCRRTGKVISLSLSILLVVLILALVSGCQKEKGTESNVPQSKAPNTCEILDKLPVDISQPVEINYDNKLKLLGTRVNKTSQNEMEISYYWQVLNDFDSYDTVFVHFTDLNNKPVSQNDHGFCQMRPYAELKDKFVKETYKIAIAQLPAGKEGYLKVGIYAPKLPNMPRLRIESAGKTSTDDEGTRAIVGKITY
jgi:hypothetical protein